MITQLDTLSWSPELVTGGADFIEVTPPGFGLEFGEDFGVGLGSPTIYVISNIRSNAAGFGLDFGTTFGSQFSFQVLQSAPAPPAPGPGSQFNVVASYIFPQPNTTFDPVAVYDATGAHPVIHIVGTRNTPTGAISSSSQSSDVIKFTYDTFSQALTGPVVLSSGTRVRGAYDITLLPNGNQMVVMALAEPAIQGANHVSFVSVVNNIATLTLFSDIIPFVPGQWVLLNDFANATFLNGELVQVISANGGEFSFAFQLPDVGFGISFGDSFGGDYAQPEDGTPFAYAQPVGDSILAIEIDANSATSQGFGFLFGESFGENEVVFNAFNPTIIESSPARSGNSFDALSLVTNGNVIELYYQTHPKVVTFQDQIFMIKLATASPADFGYEFGYEFGLGPTDAPVIWNLSPPPVTIAQYTARYSDKKLTVIADASGNRYLNQTYWSQFNHPYGILGNALLGFKPSNGAWSVHSALGTFVGGSIVQSTLAVDQSGTVTLIYLLKPFTAITNPPTDAPPAWPLQAATVTTNPPTLDLTNVPGFYNDVNFTWLRGTKSAIDNGSVWAAVGEREVLTTVFSEFQTIPSAPAPPQVKINNHAGYYENISVGGFTEVATNPARGQYTVEPSTGIYSFNSSDAGTAAVFSYSYVSAIVPVYVSLFNVPPVAALTPEIVTVYRGGSFYATDIASITGIAVSTTNVTITCVNDFRAGDQVAMYNIGTASYLNGILLTVTSATSTQFSANLSAQLESTISQLALLGFGFDFGSNFSVYSQPDTGTVAKLVPGNLTLSAAGSTDADNDTMTFVWSENDPDLVDVTLQSNGDLATLNVARKVGPLSRSFDVGVAVIDLQPDLVTQIHPALLISNAVTTGFDAITLTFAPPGGAGFGSGFGAHFGFPVPSGAVVPVAGDQVMMYDMLLTAPQAPTLGQISGGSLPAQPDLSVIVTYVNNAGETVGSDNSILSVAANNLLAVNSPSGNGTATAYNVYVGVAGAETLQTLTPQPLGSTWIESTLGLISSFTRPPLTSTALEVILNDQVLTLTSVTPTTMTAPFSLVGTFGIDFGFNFNGNYTASLTGFAIKEFQWQVADVTVPQNVAPTITFPVPLWNGNALGSAAVTATSVTSNVLTVTCMNAFVTGQIVTLNGTDEAILNGVPLTVVTANSTSFTASFTIGDYTNISDTGTATLGLPRNSQITITPTPDPTKPTTQFPVVYTGIYDPDDSVTYLWVQTGGTAVTITSGTASPLLTFETNGVNINGEALSFSLTVNDGVNLPVTVSFTLSVAAYAFALLRDTAQLSRSIWSQTATISNVAIASGVATITANNTFLAGEPVRFTGVATATFLNDVIGFYVTSANATQFTFATSFPDYPSSADTGTAYAVVPISQRNSAQIWSPMDISVLFSNLNSIKRVSVTDGSDRYIVISPYSVLVYGVFPSLNPAAVLLRRLITPQRTLILDAVHTEQDYTLVLDTSGNLFRYSTAPLIDTDNPDTTLVLSNVTSIQFTDADLDDDVKVMTTQSFADQRIIVLTGEDGAVLLQVNTTTLAVQGLLEFLTSDNLLYGADAIQFVRWVNMGNLHTGQVLLGSVVYNSAQVTSVLIAGNTLTLTAINNFNVGDEIVLSGMTSASFLNGVTVKVIGGTSTSFSASYQYTGTYGPISEASGFAEAQTSGTTYETLVDLSQGQIVGTWDKSKLKNQFVQTGEILFTPDTTYAGSPIPPVLFTPTSSVSSGKTYVTLTWKQERPDLINTYIVSYAVETQVVGAVPSTAPYTVQVPVAFTFTADEGVIDAASPIAITAAQISGNVLTITGNNSFSAGQGVSITGLTGLPALIGTTLPIATASSTQFTSNLTHADYGLPAVVSTVTVVSNVLEIQTFANHTFSPGTQVTFNGLASATFLNGQTVSIVSVPTANTFHASFTHADYGPTADPTGNIVDADTGQGFVLLNTALVSVTGTPLAGQYNVSPNGLYTFNAAQAGDTVAISIRQSFNTLQNVGSGATQSITVQMTPGQSYFFEVESFGLDGASGESNVVSISI